FVLQIQANNTYNAHTTTLSTDRLIEDEERVINGMKALVDATMNPPKAPCETRAYILQRSMSEVIESAFRGAGISEAIAGDVRRSPQVLRHHRKSDIEKISAMIKINTYVQVNERTQPRISFKSSGLLITETYKDSASIAEGIFEIKTTKRKIANGKPVSLESVITFTASQTQYKRFWLSMHLLQIFGRQGTRVMPATIIMHGKLPYDDKVFEAIVQGDYYMFTNLIEHRRARIWDCDPEGRGLLVVSRTMPCW
ncbi:unnamed protein product, partial [Aureobasidium mustum]